MKTLIRTFAVVVLLAALAVPSLAAFAQDGTPQDQLVVGGNYVLASGESVANLLVLGGSVTLEAGSTASDVLVLGGSTAVNGAVHGNVMVVGGQLTLGKTAVVDGDVSTAGGSFNRLDGAVVSGRVLQSVNGPMAFRLPAATTYREPIYNVAVDSTGAQIGWWFLKSIGLAAAAVLVLLFAPRLTERTGEAAVRKPWQAGGLGLLVAILSLPVLVAFAITLIGIPITILLAIALGVISAFGWIAIGLEVGKRLNIALSQEWPAVVSAGVGTLLLSLVANGVGLTPCVGWIVPTVVGFVGTGAVLLSRFGTRDYPAAPSAPSAPEAPVAPLAPAAPAA